MDPLSTSSIAATKTAFKSASFAYKLYKNFPTFKKWGKIVQSKINFGQTDIIDTGRSGVGKTHLIAHLSGPARELTFKEPKTSTSTEVCVIYDHDGFSKLIRVLPGQDGFRGSDKLKIFNSHEKLEGCLHVVDFGYNFPRDTEEYANHQDFEELKELNLQAEKRAYTELLCDIDNFLTKNKNNKFFIIIAINKTDLYSRKIAQAQEYYGNLEKSSFHEHTRHLMQKFGTSKIKFRSIKVCAHTKTVTYNGRIFKSRISEEKMRTQLLHVIDGMKSASGEVNV